MKAQQPVSKHQQETLSGTLIMTIILVLVISQSSQDGSNQTLSSTTEHRHSAVQVWIEVGVPEK